MSGKHACSASALLSKGASYASRNELTYGMATCRSLFFEPSVQGHWNFNRDAYRFLSHRPDHFTYAINTEEFQWLTAYGFIPSCHNKKQ